MKRNTSKHICLIMAALMMCGALGFASPASASAVAEAVIGAANDVSTPTVADAYTCKTAKELTDGDTILYNDDTVKKGIETSLYGQGSADSKKDVAKYAKYVGIGLNKPSEKLARANESNWYNSFIYQDIDGMEGAPLEGVVDLSALQLCTNMRMLVIRCDEVTGLEALTKCKKLECLILKTNKPVDLSVLAACKKLKGIGFIDCKGYDFMPLSKYAKLDTVGFKNCGDVSFLFAYNTKALTGALLVDSAARGFHSLAVLKKLEFLFLENAEIPTEELAFVLEQKKKTMASLWMTGMDCADLTAIFDCTKLHTLELMNCTGISASPDDWRKLVNLSGLGLNNCGLTDCSFLSMLKKLVLVELNDNQLTDISALAGRKMYYWVYLNGNAITDLSPLRGITIAELDVTGNPIQDKAILDELRSGGTEIIQ